MPGSLGKSVLCHLPGGLVRRHLAYQSQKLKQAVCHHHYLYEVQECGQETLNVYCKYKNNCIILSFKCVLNIIFREIV